MNIQKEIKELTLSFFETIDANFFELNGIYTIGIPEKYQNYFQKSEIKITFDEKIASENNCELIIPGSKTLFQIITNCNNKGPISFNKSNIKEMNSLIRYHFYVNFSGIKQISQLFSITLDLENMRCVDFDTELERIDITDDFKLNSDKITSYFEIVLNELRQKTLELKSSFVNDANDDFEYDLKLFASRYDDEINELDESINQKEITFNDPEKIRNYRFSTLEKIQNLEKQKKIVLTSLEEKHGIDLYYELIACEIISQ